MNIEMIVTDLDGTLLNKNGSVSDYTFYVLDKCRKTGIKVIYATGRGKSAEILVPTEKVDGYVRDNGAFAYADNRLCYKKIISMDNIRDFIVKASQDDMKIAIKINDIHYANFNTDKSGKYVYTDLSLLTGEVQEFYMPYADQKDYNYFKQNLSQEMNIFFSRENWLMVTHNEATKLRGIAAIANYFGIDKENIVVFGDDKNDITMFEYAGISVAMGNAIDEIKKNANYICADNNNNGVATWIEKNILNIPKQP